MELRPTPAKTQGQRVTDSRDASSTVFSLSQPTAARSIRSRRKLSSQAASADNGPVAYNGLVPVPSLARGPRPETRAQKRRKTSNHDHSVTPTDDHDHDPTPDSAHAAQGVSAELTSANANTAPNPAKRRRQRQTMQEIAADIVRDITGEGGRERGKKRKKRKTGENAEEADEESGKKRKRRITPDSAEEHQIAPTKVHMSDLCKDTRLGKKSKTEAKMQEIDWEEVKKKRKEAEEEAEKQREIEREERRTGRSSRKDDKAPTPVVPRLTTRNGQIVVDEDSRVVDRHAETAREAAEPVDPLEVDSLTKRVNQSTVGRQSGVKIVGSWDEAKTQLFYKGLRMFGTDFMMISKMFPGLSRRHVKLKYTREERTNLDRIHSALSSREEVDMEELAQITNKVYEDPAKINDELKADEEKIRAEDEARRVREGEQGNTDDREVLQLREQGTAEAADREDGEATAAEGESSAKENRFSSVARSAVQSATGAKKPRRQTALVRKRAARRKQALEGTEEIIGSIEDVER